MFKTGDKVVVIHFATANEKADPLYISLIPLEKDKIYTVRATHSYVNGIYLEGIVNPTHFSGNERCYDASCFRKVEEQSLSMEFTKKDFAEERKKLILKN